MKSDCLHVELVHYIRSSYPVCGKKGSDGEHMTIYCSTVYRTVNYEDGIRGSAGISSCQVDEKWCKSEYWICTDVMLASILQSTLAAYLMW